MKLRNKYCFAVTVATVLMLILVLSNTALADTHTVDDNGSKDYSTIQAAVNVANDSDTIIVYNGTYKENVDVNKSVCIISQSGNPDDTRIVANNPNDHVFHVTRDNVTISGFNIRDASYFLKVGIFLDGVQNNTISNNELSYNFGGINLDESSNNKLINNTANSNNYYGIYLIDSSSNTMSENVVLDNGEGIYLGYSNNNLLNDNNANSNNVFGIHLADSSYNMINNNTASYNMVGIMLNDKCNNNELTYNTINSNKDEGINFRHSINNKLNNNLICNNSDGIFMFDSGGNFIYNNFFKNTDNFVTDKFSSNICYKSKTKNPNIVGGPFIGGNYWTNSDNGGFSQTCTDADNDGICDSPYNIDNRNIDYLPLTINASIDIEKYTNGKDADEPKGPEIKIGNQVIWTYNVTNTGNVTLNNITINDNILGKISSPETTLEPGESMTCTTNSTAHPGQSSNLANVTAICKNEFCGGIYIDDSDMSHYFGASPSIDIELHTNDEDADKPRGPTIQKMSQVILTYYVTNTGNVNLTNINVTDSEKMEVKCPKNTLNVSESMVFTATVNAGLGQHCNYGDVNAVYEGTQVNDSDTSHYFGSDHWAGVPTANPVLLIGVLGIAILLFIRREIK